MDKLRSISTAVALALAAAACAQTQTSPDDSSSQSSPTAQTSSNPTAAGSQTGSVGEGTATAEGYPESSASTVGAEVGPATQPAGAGTTAGSPPGNPDANMAASPSERGAEASTNIAGTGAPLPADQAPEIMGAKVETPTGEALGTVMDVVLDASGSPAYVVIAAAGGPAPVPYTSVSGMLQDDKIVMERSRLDEAPRVPQGAWRDQASAATWQDEADQYWNPGTIRSASPEQQSASPDDRG